MKTTIHQAYFIPWLGYFAKLFYSEYFIVLDDVLFRKRHFFDRTKYVNMHGEIRWLSLPVGQNFGKRCKDVCIRQTDKSYVDKIMKTIELSYAKSRHYDEEWPDLKKAIEIPLQSYRSLLKININIIINLLQMLDIPLPQILYSSDIIGNPIKDPTDRIINICDYLKVNAIIVGSGMSLKVHSLEKLYENNISLYQQDFLNNHPAYEQSRRKFAGFQKGLSAIDAILNIGRIKTKEILADPKYIPKLVSLDNVGDY